MTPAQFRELLTLIVMVAGCKKIELKQKTLRDGLSLKQFLQTARTNEVTEKQVKLMEGSADIHAVQKVTRPKDNRKREEKKCFRCGESYPHEGGVSNCPAIKSKKPCEKCGLKGHFTKLCRSKLLTRQKTPPTMKMSWKFHS